MYIFAVILAHLLLGCATNAVNNNHFYTFQPMKKFLLALFAMLGLAASMQAASPCRQHRANHFAAIAPKEGRIVFIGNSITNMHEWRDAFGNPAITNRGISGAISDEVAENLESYIANKPAKVFLMIGTNDLGTSGINYPDYPFRNIKKIVDRIKRESPTTQIYLESVLPSVVGLRTKANITQLNAMVKAFCDENGITFFDLYSLMANADGSMSASLSNDGLHLYAAGYAKWCNTIQNEVGNNCIYPTPIQTLNNGVAGSHGMRLSSFAQLPITQNDIIMFGNDMQHGCEWHEMLGNPNVKNRGTGWGNASADAVMMSKFVTGTFKGLEANAAPKKIFVYVGDAEMNNANRDFNQAVADYEQLIKDIKAAAPTSDIYIESLIPHSNATTNANRYKPFNAQLQAIADRQGATFIDLFTPLMTGETRTAAYFFGNYEHLSGVGYAKVAEILAPYIGDCSPLTVDEAQQNTAVNTARNTLGQLLSKVYDMSFDGSLGNYPAEAKATLDAAVDAAYAVLAKGTSAQVAEIDAQVTALNAALTSILPQIVTPSEAQAGQWFNIISDRNNKLLTSNDAGAGTTGSSNATSKSTHWTLVKRADGKFDIKNRADGSYLNPEAGFNTQIKTIATAPTQGWTFSYCNSAGFFNIAAGTVQLNQTTINDAVYNWSKNKDGLDKDDQGCRFRLEIAPAPMQEIATGCYQIKLKTHPALNPYAADAFKDAYVYNGAKEYNQQNKNWYPLFVSKAGISVAANDPIYYVYLSNNNGNASVRSANGHGLTASCTAAETATAVPLVVDNNGVQLAAYWIPFILGTDTILGKTSNASYAATRYAFSEVDLAAQNLAAWQVVLQNAPSAANISANVQVSCENAAVKGLKSVYNNGTFFFPTDVVPVKEDFTLSDNADLSVTIDNKLKTITIAYGVKDIATGIGSVKSSSKVKSFDLQGRPIASQQRGVQITNGKKLLVK